MAQSANSRNSALKGLEASVVGQLIAEFGTFLFSPAPHDSDDVLVEVVRRDSWAALRFLRMVMLVSGVCGSIVVAFSGAFLAANWTCCAGCDRPLRWWLLLHALLQGVQVPVRLLFWFRLASESRTERVVAEFTATPAWRASKQVSLATFGWFVLGVVWVLNANGCRACPLVYRVTVGVILQAVLRAGAALLWFRHLFPLGEDGEVEPKVEAATPAQIACLPLLRHRPGLFGAEASVSCAVCLSDYAPGEYLRQLPCKHHFHQHCADRWLAKCKTCPLCVRAIDGAGM